MITFITIATLFMTIRWCYGVFYAQENLAKARICRSVHKKTDTHFVVLIPVLDEMQRITDTVRYFLDTFTTKHDMTIVIITTEEEFSRATSGRTTIDVAKELEQMDPRHVRHIHYDKRGGRMSHQLNHAIHTLAVEGMTDETLLSVYNADSRPHQETFSWIASHRTCLMDMTIFQQYGDYTRNMPHLKSLTLLSAALWQNRWALGFEYFKAVRSNEVRPLENFPLPFNYLIGHGLTISKGTYDRTIGFSEVFHNEDAILGLEVSFLRIPIVPVPYFDISDTPDTISGLYKQKIHWYFGPLQAFGYLRHLQKRYAVRSSRPQFLLAVLACKLFLHAVYWVVGPSVFVALFLMGIMRADIFVICLSYILFLLFFALPCFLAFRVMDNARDMISYQKALLALLVGGPLCYFLHGASALSAIVLAIYGRACGRQIEKGKTQMKNV